MGHANQEQDIIVQITKSFDGPDVDFSKLTKLVKGVCSRFRVSKATVSIAIVGDGEIRRLNKEFLSCDRPTDCLSFDLSDESSRSKTSKLFELVVNGERAQKEAKLRGHSGEAELALYVTHGLLHNLGFDDRTKAEAEKMHDTEDEILQQLGYGLVYNKNETAL
ncbi:MAG: rRNA maturation RNase YbeY [Phycisphaerae bacterium]|nr:rRNA maturation RNase YbeY [Phycisphaerae bacterium]NIW70760.1 rRNA maturation RNase YbeY [candidate division KSB1 bacterium]NIP51509.1 rRNA maturation RNase YbeY [Phycisphaerae bacterium]NIS50689.1 rRNA maturation RNase YbeY [Phycisphaerae bacterium]NIU08445.1 rRNA maturation RNase YbeY [Phycisphaerae bacterium]